MKYNPDIHHRRSFRLQGYDYSRAGAYFVTLCTQHRECLFGTIVDNEMRLNHAGLMVKRWYSELENKYPDIRCDGFVCMPNHTHFIVINVGTDVRVYPHPNLNERVGADLCVRPSCVHHPRVPPCTRSDPKQGEHTGSPLRHIVQWFKTMTTNEYIRGVKQNGWPPFPGKLWQRNYWEHIVRNESELNQIRLYIRNNPAQWATDRLYRHDIPGFRAEGWMA
jgi:putative transposase